MQTDMVGMRICRVDVRSGPRECLQRQYACHVGGWDRNVRLSLAHFEDVSDSQKLLEQPPCEVIEPIALAFWRELEFR